MVLFKRSSLSTLVFFVFLSLLVVKSFLEVEKRKERLETLREEVSLLRDKRSDLEDELEFRKSDAFVEQQARDELGFVKEGEIIVVLPDIGEGKEKTARKDPALESGSFANGTEVPNWQKWRRLFFSY